MSKDKEEKYVNPTPVLFYVPNLIGYLRVGLTLYSLYIYNEKPSVFIICYFLSFVLDAVDGMAARALNQSSRFGAVLDMVTDRFSTASLAIILSHFYPKFIFGFILLNILDFVSHWMQMYSTLYRGETSHKNVSKSNFLLWLYYTNRTFMGVLCVGNELFYIFLYAYHFYANVIDASTFNIVFYGLLVPTWGMKQFMNVLQMNDAAVKMIQHEILHPDKKE